MTILKIKVAEQVHAAPSCPAIGSAPWVNDDDTTTMIDISENPFF